VGEEPDEVEGAGEGGARVSSDEAEVRIRESTLSRAEEERAPAVRYLCAGESVCEPQKTARRSVELVRLRPVCAVATAVLTSSGIRDPNWQRGFLNTVVSRLSMRAYSECP